MIQGGNAMFGYVNVHKPELKMREYELYRGTYCGLCRSMGKCTGQCSRFTLSYDVTFLALARMGISGESAEFGEKRCIAHPIVKRSYMKNNPTLEYCSGAAALLNYHKAADDLSDERGLKKLRALLTMPFMAYGRKRALRSGLSELDQRISVGLSRLSELEKQKRASVDEPAGIFGEILGHIMSYGLSGKDERIAYSLGVAVGKWIYVADALDDWEKDARQSAYNPFILLYGKDSPSQEDLDGIKTALKNELIAAEDALDLVDFRDEDIKNVIMNILYLGMPKEIDTLKLDDPKKAKHRGKDTDK